MDILEEPEHLPDDVEVRMSLPREWRSIWIEPWAETLELDSDANYEVVAWGPEPTALVVTHDYDIPRNPIVWGWSGSVMTVRKDGVLVWVSYLRPPAIPPGTNMQGFFDVTGLAQIRGESASLDTPPFEEPTTKN